MRSLARKVGFVAVVVLVTACSTGGHKNAFPKGGSSTTSSAAGPTSTSSTKAKSGTAKTGGSTSPPTRVGQPKGKNAAPPAPPGEVSVGDYVGQPIQAVQRAFATNGLFLNVTYQATNVSSQAGTVAYQSPGPMALLSKGGTVTVAVYRFVAPSSTVPGVPVPALAGKTQFQAQTALEQDGLVGHFTTAATSNPADGGKVISESPGPGTQVPSGSVVTVVMGKYSS